MNRIGRVNYFSRNISIAGSRLPYWRQIQNIFGSSLIAYWPLWEASGTVANDISGNSRNGTYTGVDIGAAGIGDGKTCPYFDGTNDYVTIFSTSLRDAFNGSEGTIFIWAKVEDALEWTDGKNHYAVQLWVDNNNRLKISLGSNGYISEWYYASGVEKTNIGFKARTTDWMLLGFTWSHSSDAMQCYLNGEAIGFALTGLGDWVGTLAYANISKLFTDDDRFRGNLAHCAILNRAATPAEMKQVYLPIVSNGVVAIQFDDGYSSVYSICYPLMAARGIKGTVYMTSGQIGNTGFLTADNLIALNAAGWDIGNHTAREPDLRTLTIAEQEDEFTDCRDTLNNLGLTRANRHVAYPGGWYNADTLTAMANTSMLTGRISASDGSLGIIFPSSSPNLFTLDSPNPGNSLNYAELYSMYGKASGGICIMHQHDIGSIIVSMGDLSVEDFTTWLDYIVANDIETCTISEAYARLI